MTDPVVINRSELLTVRYAIVKEYNSLLRRSRRPKSKLRPSSVAIELASMKRIIDRIDDARKGEPS